MIKLFDAQDKEVQVKITIFPDNTSQVWQLNPEPQEMTVMRVLWHFENEAELVHICQLGMLLNHKYKVFPLLDMPYLAYGRQDKMISNQTTFARHTLIDMVKAAGYQRIITYDAHSNHPFVHSKSPAELLAAALPGHDVVCFPDIGALQRYGSLITNTPVIACQKVRNQLTGEIEGLEILNPPVGPVDLTGKKVLLCDDICDGGRTFIEAAKVLYVAGAKEVNLAVSHAILSKGLEPLLDADIKNLYTTNSFKSIINETTYYSVGSKIINIEVVKVC